MYYYYHHHHHHHHRRRRRRRRRRYRCRRRRRRRRRRHHHHYHHLFLEMLKSEFGKSPIEKSYCAENLTHPRNTVVFLDVNSLKFN